MPPSLSPSLLLLPPPPSSIESLSAAYRPPITATISALKELESSTQLIVALPDPALHGRLQEPRSHIYDQVQKLVGGLYSLICAVCAELSVDVVSDLPGSIDARILLLDYDSSRTGSEDIQDPGFTGCISGPIIDLPTLALTRRRWNSVFSVDGEDGQVLLSRFLHLANQISPPLQADLRSVSGGVSMIQKETLRQPPSQSKMHHVVVVGGTFDNLHAGHKLLLTATALLLQPVTSLPSPSRRLIIGITGDELLTNKKYAEFLKSWKLRQDDVVEFLLSILSFTRQDEEIHTQSFDEPIVNGKAIHTHLKSCMITIECVEIQDPFGPTITDEDITALVVSGETRSGGKAVNDKRVEKGWNPLEVFEIDVLDAGKVKEGATETDFASKISSTAIRKRKAENAQTSSP